MCFLAAHYSISDYRRRSFYGATQFCDQRLDSGVQKEKRGVFSSESGFATYCISIHGEFYATVLYLKWASQAHQVMVFYRRFLEGSLCKACITIRKILKEIAMRIWRDHRDSIVLINSAGVVFGEFGETTRLTFEVKQPGNY